MDVSKKLIELVVPAPRPAGTTKSCRLGAGTYVIEMSVPLSVCLSVTDVPAPVLDEIGPKFFWNMLVTLAQSSRAKILNFNFVNEI